MSTSCVELHVNEGHGELFRNEAMVVRETQPYRNSVCMCNVHALQYLHCAQSQIYHFYLMMECYLLVIPALTVHVTGIQYLGICSLSDITARQKPFSKVEYLLAKEDTSLPL